MSKEPATSDDGASAAPVACTLTPAGLTTQRGRWEQLADRAMTGRAETASGLRLSFRAEPGAEEELRSLVAVENECCPWADWAVETHGEQLVLDVRSTGTGVATLHGMFTSLASGPAKR
jgi:hypothetical protein